MTELLEQAEAIISAMRGNPRYPWADRLNTQQVAYILLLDSRCKHAFDLAILEETLLGWPLMKEVHVPAARAVSSFKQTREWPDPTPEMLHDATFDAIWQVIKSWDVAVPGAYYGYSGASGNHARAIFDAIRKAQNNREDGLRIKAAIEAAEKVYGRRECPIVGCSVKNCDGKHEVSGPDAAASKGFEFL